MIPFLIKKVKEPKKNPFCFNQCCRNELLSAQSYLRLGEWVHFLLLPVAGWLFDREPRFFSLAISLVSSALLLAHAYGFNNYQDNAAKRSVWWHRWPLIIFFLVVLFQERTSQLSAGIFLLISTVYSGRFKLKSLPIFGLVLNGVGFALFTLMAVTRPSVLNLWLFLMVMFWVAATQLIHEEAHMQQDAEVGYRTTAIMFGIKNLRVWAAFLLILASIFAFLLNPVLGLTLIVYVAVFYYLACRLSAQKLRKAMKWLGLLWAFNAGLQFLSKARLF